MLNFANFLKEEQEPKEEKRQLKHLRHTEDSLLHGGHEGVATAERHLLGLSNILLGQESDDLHVSTKYDGAPAVVFGIDPKTGKFFVATKSAFNKTPKLNFTEEDIERNHGHAPGLVEKLKYALKYLPQIMPKEGGIYQGDLMHTPGDVKRKNGAYSMTPNTITYSAPADSVEGKNMKKPLGIVVHTQYVDGNAQPLDDKTRSKFKESVEVNNIDPKIETDPSNFTADERSAFSQAMENARRLYSTMKPDELDVLEGHNVNLEAHINNMVRSGGEPSAEGYIQHITDRHIKQIEKLKTQKAKDKYIQAHSEDIAHITKNKAKFKKILELHKSLQKAKNVLIRVLNKNSVYQHSIGDKPATSEGTVVVDNDGNATKLVSRDPGGFAAANLGGMGKMGKAKIEKSKDKSTRTIWWGRGQPLTKGHEAGINQAISAGNHEIIFSHTQDEKNPLSAEQKIKYAKLAFPTANIKSSSKEQPSILHHAARAHKEGVRNFNVIAGADRVDQYKQLLKKYNKVPGPHGMYDFDKINVISAGERDEKAKGGLASISGTKARKAASEGKREAFHAMLPDTLSVQHKDAYLKDLQTGMQKFKKPDITIDSRTSGISLGKYVKRQDKIGVQAKREIERRQRSKKTIKEETQSAGEAVRGFGDVSGNPAVQDDPIQQYISTNQLAKDNENGALMKMMKDSKHDILGFKSFDPKELEKFKKGNK